MNKNYEMQNPRHAELVSASAEKTPKPSADDNGSYNPDILECLANLSNDEVFTPPKVANEMLDLLPQELFQNPDATFLDPACKSGVFLREIAKRLLAGLKDKIPDLQERADHIFTKQLFGIAITELTGLLSRRSIYCAKYADSKYSVTRFESRDGNIFFSKTPHTFKNGKCVFCGASEEQYGSAQSGNAESHAYQFIHNATPEEIKEMHFDVIIGNPPYQMETGGSGKQAKPIYQIFVEKAQKLNPKYLVMIIPSRWFSGGFGLDDFRNKMLNDRHLTDIVDFPNSSEVFSGVDIAGGVCYFKWDRDNEKDCEITNVFGKEKDTQIRKLNEYKTFVRFNKAVSIIRKVFLVQDKNKTLENVVSPQRPFGLPTNYAPRENGIPCWFIQKIGLKFADEKDVDDSNHLLDKWKFIAPKAPIAGQTDFTKPVGFYYDGNTKIAKPGECCTESFIVLGAFDTEEEVKSFKSYIFTKTVRFLLLQTVISQDVLRNKFCFVPDLGKYEGTYTDKMLCEKWNITDEEWKYIDSRIRNYDE